MQERDLRVVRDERIPPSNVELEEEILGGVLLDPTAIERISTLSPLAFYMTPHQILFRAALKLHSEGRAINVMSMMDALGKSLEAVGGQKRLFQLVDSVVSTANIDQYAEMLQALHQRRQVLEMLSEMGEMVFDTSISVSKLMETAESRLLSMVQKSRKRSAVKLADVLTDRFADLEARSQGLVESGISCGFYDLDAMTQGFQRSDLIIIAGRPAMGKTSLAIQLARNISAGHGLPILVFSLEMSKAQLADRILSLEAQVESGRLRSGQIYDNEWEGVGHCISRLSVLPIYLDDASATSVSEMSSIARLVAAENDGVLGGIVIDYLQLMVGGDGEDVKELSRITRQLKLLAGQLNCPVFALSQLNRSVESRTNKRPMMSDLRQSGSIEQDADLIIMLYRDEYYNPESSDRGISEIIITKHRNGPVGTVKLLFEPQFTRFRNLGKPGGDRAA